ncbi:ParA family protein [Fundidesulfovibrio magnetotacticus]|uniref:ParA family protein n=1 Tax=Fundidesulfovibrio magnetotacticus TaxID=2730080 RepID=UPI001563CFF0|nr:ParA family protein [Fundidesulfovibrio magnetotacticus]
MGCSVLAVANQKGGVGKTTTALTLGAALTRMGRRTLVMDLDPHGCASVHLGHFPENVPVSAYDLLLTEGFDAGLWGRALIRGAEGRMDMVASNVRLSELDIDLKGRENKGLLLKKLLGEAASDYDFVILDCPPNMGVLLVNAMVASNLLIIPIQTDFLALHGLRLIFDSIRLLNKVLPRPVAWRALATMFDRRAGACRRVLHLLRGKLGPKLFETVIDMDTQFREASASGGVIYDIAPDSRGAREYMALAKEIVTS